MGGAAMYTTGAIKLGLTDPDDVYMTERAKGMHRCTFERLRSAVIRSRREEEHAPVVMLRRALGSLRIRT